MTIPLSNSSLDVESPRPKDVGILAMEVYFPRRVSAIFFPLWCKAHSFSSVCL